MKLLLALIVCFIPVGLAQVENIAWNCTGSPNACENFCFATYCRNVPNLYQRHKKGKSEVRRRRTLSGAAYQPCTSIHRNTYWCRRYGYCKPNPPKDIQCDEWPKASLVQGGAGAWLRCMDGWDNNYGGQQGATAQGDHRFVLSNLDHYPPGFQNVFCGRQDGTGRNCGDLGALDKQFYYKRPEKVFVDSHGNPPPGGETNPCVTVSLYARQNTPQPSGGLRIARPQPQSTCDADGLTAEDKAAEEQLVTDAKLRVRTARELVGEIKANERRWLPPAKYLTSRGSVVSLPRQSEDDAELQERDVVWEASGEKSYIVKRLD